MLLKGADTVSCCCARLLLWCRLKANRFTGNVALIRVDTKKSNYGKELGSAFLLSLSVTVLKDLTVKIYSYRGFRNSDAVFIWFLVGWLC